MLVEPMPLKVKETNDLSLAADLSSEGSHLPTSSLADSVITVR